MIKFEKFRGNIDWLNLINKKKFSVKNTKLKDINKIDKELLEKIDIYNFEVKTLNIIAKLKVSDFPKNIPIIILWSPYFDSATKISKEKVAIIDEMNKKLDNYNNIIYMYLNAPHQMERVLPITLSKFIITSIISAF